MKLSLSLRLATLATIVLTTFMSLNLGKAAAFDEQDLDQTQIIAIARPYGDNKYDLLVIEQIPKKRQCWSENGASPILVNPLLMNFDFTGICRRSTDSNGYSIRVNGEDYGLNYLLRLVERNGELVLIGTPRTNTGQEIVLGRTSGMSRDFMKITLDPGWRFTKRTFNGKALGHFYFSNLPASSPSPSPSPSLTPTPTPSVKPTPIPSVKPSAKPSPKPSAKPSVKPSAKPSAKPSPKPSAKPSPKPSAKPSPKPSAKPTPTPRATTSPTPKKPSSSTKSLEE